MALDEVWETKEQLIKLGHVIEKNREHINTLDDSELETLYQTCVAGDMSEAELGQLKFDLVVAKYPLYDMMSMWVGVNDFFDRVIKVYLTQRDVKQFIQYLRVYDLTIMDLSDIKWCEYCYAEVNGKEEEMI